MARRGWGRGQRADRPPAARPDARHDRPPRPPAAAPQRRCWRGPPPARLAGALHLPARARLRRGDRGAAGAGRVPGVRGRGDDDGGHVRRGVRAVAGRRVPGGRGARDAGGDRQGDDGSRELRLAAGARQHPGGQPPAVGRPVQPLARQGRGPAAVRVHAAVRDHLQPRDAARVRGAGRIDRCVLADPPVRGPRRARRGRAGCTPRPSTISMSTTAPAGSGRGRSSPTRSTSRTGRSPASPSRTPRWRTARHRTCSCRRARCRCRTTWPTGSGWASGRTSSAGPELSIFANMRAGAYTQSGLHVLADGRGPEPLDPLDWLRLGTLGGARALGLRRRRSGRSRRARRPT